MTVLLTLPAQAAPQKDEDTVSDLANECRAVRTLIGETSGGWTSDTSFASGKCLGFIIGVNEAMEAVRSDLFCLPPNVTYGQQALVFVKWVEQNPAQMHAPRMLGFTAAMHEAFPCE